MAKNKMKMLNLVRIFTQETDDEHALTLRAGVENLFDKRYTTYADWCDIPQKGRNIYVNLSVQL